MLVILVFLALIPGLEALPPRAVADHRVPEVARARQRAEPRFREGAGRPRNRQGPRQQDGARRVHLRRVRAVPGELSGVGRGQGAEPEDDHPADAGRAARGRARREARRDLHREGAVAVHDVRRLREPVPGRHRASAAHHRLAPRAGVERRGARVSRRDVQPPRAPREHLGTRLRSAAEVRRVGRRSRPSIRPSTTSSSGSDAPARSRPTSRSHCGRCSRSCARAACASACCRRSAARAIRRSGPATSTCIRSWPTANIEELKSAGPKKILTSCPHCVKTIGDDYRQFGYEVEIVHRRCSSRSSRASLPRRLRPATGER